MVGTSVQLFFVISSLLFCLSYGWMNAMDKPLSYKCPDGMAISEINSKHDNFFEDRVFDISCRFTGKTPTGCQWTGKINKFLSKVIIFYCQTYCLINDNEITAYKLTYFIICIPPPICYFNDQSKVCTKFLSENR